MRTGGGAKSSDRPRSSTPQRNIGPELWIRNRQKRGCDSWAQCGSVRLCRRGSRRGNRSRGWSNGGCGRDRCRRDDRCGRDGCGCRRDRSWCGRGCDRRSGDYGWTRWRRWWSVLHRRQIAAVVGTSDVELALANLVATDAELGAIKGSLTHARNHHVAAALAQVLALLHAVVEGCTAFEVPGTVRLSYGRLDGGRSAADEQERTQNPAKHALPLCRNARRAATPNHAKCARDARIFRNDSRRCSPSAPLRTASLRRGVRCCRQ